MRARKGRVVLIAMVICALMMSGTAYAKINDVPDNASYAEALNHVTAFGIMSVDTNGNFYPDDVITREQFAKMIVVASGLEEAADVLKGTTIYPDVSPDSWSSGYINVVLNKGYLSGMPDGKFHPEMGMTFAMACTVMVKALGYTDQDVSNVWPRNYMDKAKSLGLTEGMTLSGNDYITRATAAVMMDRLLATNMKNTGTEVKTFGANSGLYTQCIILANSSTMKSLSPTQVMTDKGIYYVSDTSASLELGNQYAVYIDGDLIVKVFNKTKSLMYLAVANVIDTTISYSSGNELHSMVLPDKTVYYYNGVKQSYENLKTIIQYNSSIIFAYNSSFSGYDYAIINDPVYSKPEVAINFNSSFKKLGTISFDTGIPIIRNGEIVNIGDIEDKDVVYQVSDLMGTSKYILVVNDEITGKISGIYPNKLSPKSIKIDNASYDFDKYMDFTKINNPINSFKVDDDVIALLGYDGKVVDILYQIEDTTSEYAFVINYSITTSTNIADYGSDVYYVKLLLSNGTIDTYKALDDPTKLKGKLVTYDKYDVDDDGVYDIVRLNTIEYNNTEDITINKDDRQINSYYVVENAKIFNIVANDSGTDTQVSLIKWSDLPNGVIPKDKVLFLNKQGTFEDIDVVVLDDIFNQELTTGFIDEDVKSIPTKTKAGGYVTTYTYTIGINGKDYTYSSPNEFKPYTAVAVRLSANGTISYISYQKVPTVKSTKVDAIDSKRIKINNNVYYFDKSTAIYYKDSNDKVTVVGADDINTNTIFGKVEVYLNRLTNNTIKVDMVYISEK